MCVRHPLLLVLLVGCNSNGAGSRPCQVNCPPGTYCDGDRCLPLCSPPCGPSQHCGTDRICHDGPAPDGNVVVAVEGGIKVDANTGKGDGPAAKPDSVNPNQQLCDCLAQQPKSSYCNKQAVACQMASDCCWSLSSIPCGTYGNKYSCTAGQCEPSGCSSKAECVTYAQAIKQPDAQGWTCHPAPCPGGRSYCGAAAKVCNTAADCCTAGQVPCGAYTNHWTCDGGKCRYQGCASGSECVTYAQAIGLPDPSTYVCTSVACYGTGYCSPKPKPCGQPSDCCLFGSTVPCGVYSNRYRCEAGGCVLDGCTGKQDCLSYASALQLPDANEYNCIVY